MKDCIPLRFVADNALYRGRLGGAPPLGVTPRFADQETAYFATVPLSAEFDVSVFLSTSYTDPARNISHLAHKLLPGDCGFVEALVHPPAPRDEIANYWELIPSASIVALAPLPDNDVNWEGCRYMGHKIGGLPGLVPGNQHWDVPLERLFAEGYELAVQFAFPSYEDVSIEGSWPFGELSFFLFHRKYLGVDNFKFLWTR